MILRALASHLLTAGLGLAGGWYLALHYDPATDNFYQDSGLAHGSGSATITQQQNAPDSKWTPVPTRADWPRLQRQLQDPAFTLPPTQLPALISYLQQLADSEQWQTLSNWLALLQARQPRNAHLWALQARLDIALRRFPEAADALLLALESAQPDQRSQLQHSLDELMRSLWTRAQQQLPEDPGSDPAFNRAIATVLQAQPDHHPHRWLTADSFSNRGDLQQALDELQWLPYDATYEAATNARRKALQAQLDARDRAAAGIPLESSNGHYYVTATFDHRVTLRLLVDTGASVTALRPEAIALLDQYGSLIDTGRVAEIGTANGRRRSPVYQVPSLDIAGWQQDNVTVLSADIGSSDVDGLLGINFFGGRSFRIDSSRSALILEE